MRRPPGIVCAALLLAAARSQAMDARDPDAANPLLPGYYADPSIVAHEGKYHIYATLDPWGGETLGCWSSPDFKNWTFHELNWPTKKDCTSPTSQKAMVWAPSVVRGADGKFHMYVSVGSEVWAGVADNPLGPWTNALGDKPLIPADYKPGFHMIDAEAFIDDDGQAYLYWGSGLNWVNGRCWTVKLKPDMVTFDGEVRDVTPKNYFEGPFVVKRHGKYFLMNSVGKTTEDTYQVRYAVGDTPFGPFEEPANNTVIETDKAKGILGPGHHAVFAKDGKDYILYHRHSVPFDAKFVGRQICADEIRFTPDGKIAPVQPTHEGPGFLQGRTAGRIKSVATASGQRDKWNAPENVTDNNYATKWAAPADTKGAWLQLDLVTPQTIARQEIRFEYAWKPYRFKLEASDDGKTWRTAADRSSTPAQGSPLIVEEPVKARYLRLAFPPDVNGSDIAVWEWGLYP